MRPVLFIAQTMAGSIPESPAAFNQLFHISSVDSSLRNWETATLDSKNSGSSGSDHGRTVRETTSFAGSKALFLVPVLASVGFQMSCQSVLDGSQKEPHRILASIGLLANCAKLSSTK
jgi:hypothetical protein